MPIIRIAQIKNCTVKNRIKEQIELVTRIITLCSIEQTVAHDLEDKKS